MRKESERIQATEVCVERREEESTADYLRRLEVSGQFLFHGSPREIGELEPRDPVTDATDNPDNKQLAVYAYSSAALGVQRAIISGRDDVEGDWDIVGGTDPESPETPLLMTTPNIPLQSGYLHILPRSSFRQTGGYQWVSESPVKPYAIVDVDPGVYRELGGEYREIK